MNYYHQLYITTRTWNMRLGSFSHSHYGKYCHSCQSGSSLIPKITLRKPLKVFINVYFRHPEPELGVLEQEENMLLQKAYHILGQSDLPIWNFWGQVSASWSATQFSPNTSRTWKNTSSRHRKAFLGDTWPWRDSELFTAFLVSRLHIFSFMEGSRI